MSKYSGMSTGEVLAAMDREKEYVTSFPQFWCALGAWIVSILAVPAAALWPRLQIYLAIGVFLLTIAIAAWTGIFTGKLPYKLQKPKDLLETLNWAVYALSAIVFVVAFVISVSSGGRPAVTETGYAVVSSGQVVRELTEGNYRFLCAARGAMLSLLTFFNCLHLAYVKKGLPKY